MSFIYLYDVLMISWHYIQQIWDLILSDNTGHLDYLQ